MRIIGTIPHPQLKISVFRYDGRLSLKLETPLYEQTFKLGDDERFASLEDAQRFADEPFLQAALAQFQAMHQARMQALARFAPQPEGEVFEEII